jgi:hypothetical protein
MASPPGYDERVVHDCYWGYRRGGLVGVVVELGKSLGLLSGLARDVHLSTVRGVTL